MPQVVLNITDPIFIDKDDNTVFHIFQTGLFGIGLGSLSYEQFTSTDLCANADEIPPGPFPTLGMVDPLPSDFRSNSGSISRFPDRLSLFLEEYTPTRVAESPEFANVPIRKTYISRYDFVNTETLGVSNGLPNQSLSVSGSQILLPTLGTPTVFVGGLTGEKWTVVVDLSLSGPDSRNFEYDSDLGKVTFGNGTNGAIPESGQSITLRVSIRNGGGKWEFAGIIVPQKDKENIGMVKSVRDKIFYVHSEIAAADTTKITQVVSTLNVVQQSGFASGDVGGLLFTGRRWSLELGGSVSVSGGPHNIFNTGIKEFYSKDKVPNPAHPTHSSLTISGEYPNMSALSSGFFNGTELDFFNETTIKLETTKIEGGLVTSPKEYAVSVAVYPIMEVRENMHFNSIERVGPPGNQVCVIVPEESYLMEWTIPSKTVDETFQCIAKPPAQSCPFDGSGDIIRDSDGFGQARGLFDPILTGGGWTARQTQIGPFIGSFDNPTWSSELTGYGDILNTWYVYTNVPSQVDFYGKAQFSILVNGDATEHPEWVTVTYEVRAEDSLKNAWLSLGVAPPEDFICTWTAIKGEIETLSPSFSFCQDDP